MAFDQHTLHQVWISIPVMVFAFSHTPIISTFAVDRREKYGDAAMGKCKNHEGGIPDHLPERAVLRLQLPAFDSAVLYCGRQRGRGNDPVRAVDDALFSGLAGISGIIVAIIAMSKSFLGTYFGVIEGATEIVKSSLNQV
jgi:amino acid permease